MGQRVGILSPTTTLENQTNAGIYRDFSTVSSVWYTTTSKAMLSATVLVCYSRILSESTVCVWYS
jgi:hypothetical protein